VPSPPGKGEKVAEGRMRGLASVAMLQNRKSKPLTLAVSPEAGERGQEQEKSLLPLARGRRWPKAG